jgi:Tubulin-tyrosine ligase family
MHQNVYFRIANKPHKILTALDLADHESVLTATHLLDDQTRTSDNILRILPIDTKTIQKLEHDYKGKFDWNNKLLPQIQTMICELFNGMTQAYPTMEKSIHSRAVYGIDVMFEITDIIDDDYDSTMIIPKLTEVTFCPANNAVCDAYERNEELYRSYNKDIFELLFLGIKSERIIQLQ